ncbi:MAG: VWA domain-containing protein [Bryobacteraceae bacterium]
MFWHCVILALAAQQTPVFRTGVTLVRIDAEVVDDGRALTDFGRDDFRVFDDGKPQAIVQFAAELTPLDIVLLFDTSASMKPAVERVTDAVRLGLAELRPDDRVAVMSFNRESRLVAPFTSDLAAVERAIRDGVLGARFGGGTLIQSAAEEAADLFLPEPRTERRRAVLMITDNFGFRNRRESRVVEHYWEADAVLCGLIVRNAAVIARNMIAGPMLFLRVGMDGIAGKTGCDAVKSDDPGTAFQETMRRIRQRYIMCYVMPEGIPGIRRQIKVELAGEAKRTRPEARVRSRTGYVVPAR